MFERFTRQARQVVVVAQDEARLLDHGAIGTEHLLLALLRDPETGAGQALTAAGIAADAVRAQLPPGEGAPAGHIPFSPRAKKVLELSLRESIKLRHRTIEPEHILLGLIREGQGLAAQVLSKLGADLEAVREDVLERMAPRGRSRFFASGGTPRLPDMTRAGAAALERARTLAGGLPVGSHHLLLALFGGPDSLARRVLEQQGLTEEAVAEEVAKLDPADTADESPDRARARRTRLEVAGDVVTMRVQDADLAARLWSLGGWRRASGDAVELSGTEPGLEEPFARLWRAVHVTSDEILQRVAGPAASVSADWKPPGWTTQVSVAAYAISNRPDGPRSELFTAEGIDEAQVRSWLAGWLAAHPGLQEGPCVYFTVVLGRVGDAVPEALDPGKWVVSSFSAGAGPAPAEWPRVPLADLVAHAVRDLEDPAATATG